MWPILVLALMAAQLGVMLPSQDAGPIPEQNILSFKKKTEGPIGIMTTSAGAPIEYKESMNTLNSRLIFNEYIMDSLTHLVRERIPERVVHAKAGGAFGYFEVTHDLRDICKAKLFDTVGKRTPVAARFSPVVVSRGGADTVRDPRGFAVKFYTEEGNFDIVGFNTPMFALKDPVFFTTFVHAQKPNPATDLTDGNMFWDLLTQRPETLHMFLLIFADRGIPDGYRHMPGFGIHTFQVVNKRGDNFFIRFHLYPESGIKNLRSDEARKIAAYDPDYANRDLYRAINNGNFPVWNVSVQVLNYEDVKTAGFDIFDVTKVLPLDRYPLRPVGRMVLDKAPINYFAEIEQLAYNPANLVPGILGGADKLFEARRMAYRDAQYYRLGSNFNKIAVNCPLQVHALTYNRDGKAPVLDNERDRPNFYPNSFHGPLPYVDKTEAKLVEVYQDDPNNFDQARALYINEMTEDERSRMVENIFYSLGPVADFLKEKAVKLFTIIHPDLGGRIKEGLLANTTITHHDIY